MANKYVLPSAVANEVIIDREDSLVFSKTITRSLSEEFNGTAIGDSVRIKNFGIIDANDYDGNEDSLITSDVTEKALTLTIEKWAYTKIKVTSKERALDIKDFKTQILDRVTPGISKSIEQYNISKIEGISNYVDSISGAPSSMADLTSIVEATEKANFDVNQPTFYVMKPSTKKKIMDIGDGKLLAANFSGDQGKALASAQFGQLLGLNFFVSNLLPKKVAAAGDFDSVTVVGGASKTQDKTQIIITGSSADAVLNAGNILTVTSSNGVVSKMSVSEKITLTGSDDVVKVHSISEDVLASATVEVKSVGYGCVYQKDAFVTANVPLPLPLEGSNASVKTDAETGSSIRVRFLNGEMSDFMIVDTLLGSRIGDVNCALRLDNADD